VTCVEPTLPEIGVVVAAPEGEWEPAVHSLLRQSLPPAAITVVTPADPLPDPRLHFARCASETAAEVCVEAARAGRTPYVAFLHGRDEAFPDWLRHLAGAARDDAGLVQCSGCAPTRWSRASP